MLSPALILGLETVYTAINPYMFYILFFFLIFAVINTEDLSKSLQLAAASGLLGIYSFNLSVNQNFVLIPVFTGLFAVPVMTTAIRENTELPEQDREFETNTTYFSGVIGASAGLIAGIVPGIGPAISTTFLTPISRKKDDFITALGGVNSSDIVTSLLALYIIGSPRSGASIAINQLTEISAGLMSKMAAVALISAILSYVICLKVSYRYVDIIQKIDYRKVTALTLLLLISITYLFTGILGLLVLTTASAIGFAARTHDQNAVVMSVLIIPALLMFAGTGITM